MLPQVANGMDARSAWEVCGEPKGEAGIQNIRKRGMKLRQQMQADLSAPPTEAAADAPQDEEVATAQAVEVFGKGKPVKGFRLGSNQLAKTKSMADNLKRLYNMAYVAATNEWADMVANGTSGKRKGGSADSVAARYNATLPSDCKQLTGRALMNALLQGRQGVAPRNPGPATRLPADLIQSIADFSALKQAEGDEQQPRQLARVARAAVAGTRFEEFLSTAGQASYVLRRVREVSGISVAMREAVDDRRWQYLTSGKLSTWFEGYIDCLIAHAPSSPSRAAV